MLSSNSQLNDEFFVQMWNRRELSVLSLKCALWLNARRLYSMHSFMVLFNSIEIIKTKANKMLMEMLGYSVATIRKAIGSIPGFPLVNVKHFPVPSTVCTVCWFFPFHFDRTQSTTSHSVGLHLFSSTPINSIRNMKSSSSGGVYHNFPNERPSPGSGHNWRNKALLTHILRPSITCPTAC